MSLDYSSHHLLAAVKSLAHSEQPVPERLQLAWDEHVQMLWMKPCLTVDLLREFRDLWHRYTAPSDDRQSTVLRRLTPLELRSAVSELVNLSTRTSLAAWSTPDVPLATLADLS
jgi:hypothetical protein